MADPTRARPLASFGLDGEDWGGVLRYGPLAPDERALRLIGNVAAKRVLLLGTRSGQAASALAASGAKVIAVEPSPDGVASVRRHCADRGLAVEVHQRDLAELAFVRADTVDLAVSVLSLAAVADLGRVFRQVHRVLRSEAPLVLSLPHPMSSLLEPLEGSAVGLRRAYGETEPVRWSVEANGRNEAPLLEGVDHTHSIEAAFSALTRANFRIDTLVEPMAKPADPTSPYWVPAMAYVPVVLIVRARKLGA